ncbi:MAG TPA: hypothetical protein VJZ71_15635 [Phycisphaerae bacterium]|nr:hypothetical protein [Phycisphaerae bacterium]
MSWSLSPLVIHMVVALATTQPTPLDTQEVAPETPLPQRPPTDERRPRRERMDRLRDATPAQRRQFQVDRWVDRADRMYELDDDQKSIVRIEIENMQRERREAMGPEAEEYDRLREQMFQFWRPMPGSENAERGDRETRRERRRRMMEDPRFLQVRRRLQELERKYPAEWEEAMRRVEALLPAEQAQKGREKFEERSARRQEREERWRRRGAEPRPVESASTPTAPDAPVSPATDAPTLELVPPSAPHPWEVYVRDFSADHELTAAQQAAAQAVLKDIRTRAAQMELTLRDKIAAAEKMPDSAARTQRLAELQQPSQRLFDELKTRLDGLLTATQRASAKRPK